MAIFQSALFVFQSLFGLSSRKDKSPSGTDWLKLALAVASQPEGDESRSTVRNALQTNNQEFLDYLRSALDTRSAATRRVAEINSDGVECRAFLPGSPALWGWTTNMAAEAAVLQAGIEDALDTSVFDSPSGSPSSDSQGAFEDSSEMGGATLRDIYAKAWELHREPLIWTPRGPVRILAPVVLRTLRTHALRSWECHLVYLLNGTEGDETATYLSRIQSKRL
ncbi:hypothetical protein RSOL_321540, partial [Rhizoctonia solani AG-3 Rhs1AP]